MGRLNTSQNLHNLSTSSDIIFVVKDYTYVKHALLQKSCIDHFIFTEHIFYSIVDSIIIFKATNPSKHNCIQLTITYLDSEVYSQSTQVQLNHD